MTSKQSDGRNAPPGPTSSPLTAENRDRLVAILGMLGSTFDSERAAAGLIASRLLRDRGLTWDRVIAPPAPAAGDWRAAAADAAQCHEFTTAWERGFLRKLRGFRVLSDRQREVLDGILERVRTGMEDAA